MGEITEQLSLFPTAESMSVSVENQFNVSQMHISNEVFESLDEPMSSRTVSQDKISTITEVSQECINNVNSASVRIPALVNSLNAASVEL